MSNAEKIGADAPEFSKLLIIGAGMSGISTAAYYKKKYGDDDYVIYERQKQLGGTWWMNNYPGGIQQFPCSLLDTLAYISHIGCGVDTYVTWLP